MKILSNVLIKAGLIVEGAADFQDGTTAVTVATSDNSTKVATTAFVKNQGYALDSGVVHLSGAETITGVKTFSSSVTGNASAAIFSPTLTASGNFNVMVGVDVNPTFVNGSYTSLQNIALRVQGLMQVGTSGSFAANSTIAAFGYNANSQVSITYGSTFDITTLNVGNSFSITRNGASVPSMNASQGLNYYGGPLNLYGVFNGTTYPPGELRITGNYGFGSAAIGAYNSANSALFIGNSHTTYAYTQFTYARNVVWQQTDTSTSPTYNASAIFNLQSTTRGMLIPRMTTTQRDAIATPATGLEVYNTTTNRKNVYNGSTWVDLAVSGDLSSYVPASRTITINGTSYDLTADRSWSVTPNVNAFQEYTYTATAGQTTFAATYTVGQVQVYYNGSKLEPVEYTATNGTSIVFSPGLNAGDIVDIIAYQTGAGIGGSGTIGKHAKFTASGTIGDSIVSESGTTVSIAGALTSTGNLTANGVTIGASDIRSSSGTLTLGGSSELMRLNSTGVGIGTNAPSYLLDVSANNSTFTARIRNLNTATDNAGLLVQAGVNAGNEIILLKNSVGTDRLGIYANGIATATAATSGWGASFYNAWSSSVQTFLSHGGGYGIAVDSAANSSSIYLLKLASGDGTNRGTNEMFKVLANGFVGINNANPNGRLHIGSDDTPSITGTTPTGAIIMQSTATTALTMGVYASNPFYGWIQMRHGALSGLVYGLAIQPLGGQVMFGTTTGSSTSMFSAKSTTTASRWQFGPNTYNSSDIFRIENQDTTGVYLTSGNTSWTANSDERLKNIDSDIVNAVDNLMALRTVKFSWKKDSEKKINLGLIAQDVIKVFPEIVDINEDDMQTLGVKYTELVPVLVKAVQELKAERDSDKKEIELLKAQLGTN